MTNTTATTKETAVLRADGRIEVSFRGTLGDRFGFVNVYGPAGGFRGQHMAARDAIAQFALDILAALDATREKSVAFYELAVLEDMTATFGEEDGS